MIRASKLTTIDRGGIGKNLSDGWCLNYAVGCTHGCPFCYVDSIHKRFGQFRYGEIVLSNWGDYILVPEGIEDAITHTPWDRWQGKEVMLSSTHDPYIPELRGITRTILEHALPSGVRFCIQTRSTAVLKDFDLLENYRHQVRLQMSVSSMNNQLSRAIEPRVPSTEARLEALREAKAHGFSIGVIVAPVFPPLRLRPDVRDDLRCIARELSDIDVDYVFGESLHRRGDNLRAVEDAVGESLLFPTDFDSLVGSVFRGEMKHAGVRATWWGEHASRPRREHPSVRGTAAVIEDVPVIGGNGICLENPKAIVIGSRGILKP